MEYEYMALSSEDGAYAGQCRVAVRNKELADKGWKNWRMIPWYESGIVSICVVRRELKPKDEPHMWTEAEIRDLMQEVERRKDARLCCDPNRLVMTTSGKRVPAYTLEDRPTGHYVDPVV